MVNVLDGQWACWSIGLMANRPNGQLAQWLIGSMVNRSNSERLRGFGNGLTDRQTDICYSKVAFATENANAQFILGLSAVYMYLKTKSIG